MAATAAASQICWPSRYWLRWFVLFLGSLVVGAILAWLFRPVHKVVRTYLFEGRNTQGEAVATEYLKDGKWYDLDQNYRDSREAKAEQDFEFRPKGTPDSVREHVVWRTPEDHKTWLEKDFNDRLKTIDPNHNKTKWKSLIDGYVSHSKNGTLDYPIVFKTK